MIRYLILMLLLFCSATALRAQNKELLYDFVEVPQALLLNPGMETAYNWHVGVPLLSGISVQAATSGLSVNDIFANDGLDINDKVRDRAVYGMDIRDDVTGVYQIDVLNGGFRGRNDRRNYFSFGLYHEGYAINYWPRDLAILAYEGNADQLDRRFDLSHLKTKGQVVNVFHFGMNRQMNRRLTLGARAKIYSGIFDYNSSTNDGYFTTNRGDRNILSNTLVSDMVLRSSGFDALSDATDDGASSLTKVVASRGLFGGDLGLGFDLGFTYAITDQTLISGSLLDLGLIYHSTDVRNYTLDGAATIEGIEVILPNALLNPNADFWQELVDEIEALIPFEENENNYVTFRPIQFYGSVRHNWGLPGLKEEDCECDYKLSERDRNIIWRNSAGAQLHMVNRPRGPQAALTAFYQRRIGNILALKGTYTVDKYTYTNLGLGLSIQGGPVNFYVMANNLLGYRNLPASHLASFQIGLNIISWNGN